MCAARPLISEAPASSRWGRGRLLLLLWIAGCGAAGGPSSGASTEAGSTAATGGSGATVGGASTASTASSTQGGGTETSDGSAGDTGSGGMGTASASGSAGGTTGGTTGGGGASVPLRGVNLAGAEFGPGSLPGVFGADYTYPTASEVDWFMGKGMNVFRLPFLWERLQPTAEGPFDPQELARLRAFVDDAIGKGAHVVLDPHNYARYYDEVIGGGGNAPATVFADLWARLAAEFKDEDRVIFGLMNEPHDMPTELWLDDANAALAAIRAAGANNLVLVPGNAYTGAHSWNEGWYGTPNGQVMGGVVDPGDHFAYELHQYLDADSSGTSQSCVSATVGSERLVAVTDWLRQQGAQGFLGEFGGSADPTCLAALDDILVYLEANDDVWLGWTYWAAGPWWGEYMFSLEPSGGMDRPQMEPLSKHLPAP